MHLSLLLLIACCQTNQQTQEQPAKQAIVSPINGHDSKSSDTESRIPHFRSALKTPSNQTAGVQSGPPTNSFVPPATPNFSPGSNPNQAQNPKAVKKSFGDSTGFSPVNPNATAPLRGSTGNTMNGVPGSDSTSATSSSQQSAAGPPASPIQPAITQSPTFSPKASAAYPPAGETQKSATDNGNNRASFDPSSGGFTNQRNAAGTDSSLRQSRPTENRTKSNPSTRSRSIDSGTADALNSSPTIEPRGIEGVNRKRDRSVGGQYDSGQPIQKKTQPEAEQDLDLTYDPQLKAVAESILKSNPRGEKNRVGLADVVRIAQSTSQRKQIIRDYWNGFVNQADADFAAEERRVLQQLSQPNRRLDQSLIRASIRSCEARLAEANLEMAKSNSKIYTYMPSLTKGQELVYADLPWVGKYKTNASQLVSSGRYDAKILNVDKALIGVRDLIQLRAAAVYENMTAMQEAITEYQNGRAQLSVILMLHKEVRDQRIAFLTSVRDYNIAIADYAITAYPAAADPRLVAGMLVDTKQTLPRIDVVTDRQIRQASGIQNPDAQNNGFQNNADPVVRQAGGF